MAFRNVKRTISKETADFPVENNLLSKITETKFKLSALALPSKPLTPTHLSSASSDTQVSSESFQATHVHEKVDFIEMPAILDSRQTLEYIGLDSRAS